jgi:hypothetical protein
MGYNTHLGLKRTVGGVLFFRKQWFLGVHPKMVDFGSGQGRSEFASAGVVTLRRGLQRSENAGLGRKTPFLDGH